MLIKDLNKRITSLDLGICIHCHKSKLLLGNSSKRRRFLSFRGGGSTARIIDANRIVGKRRRLCGHLVTLLFFLALALCLREILPLLMLLCPIGCLMPSWWVQLRWCVLIRGNGRVFSANFRFGPRKLGWGWWGVRQIGRTNL